MQKQEKLKHYVLEVLKVFLSFWYDKIKYLFKIRFFLNKRLTSLITSVRSNIVETIIRLIAVNYTKSRKSILHRLSHLYPVPIYVLAM